MEKIQFQNMIDTIFTSLSNPNDEYLGKMIEKPNHLQFIIGILSSHPKNNEFFIKYLILHEFRKFSTQIQFNILKLILYYPGIFDKQPLDDLIIPYLVDISSDHFLNYQLAIELLSYWISRTLSHSAIVCEDKLVLAYEVKFKAEEKLHQLLTSSLKNKEIINSCPEISFFTNNGENKKRKHSNLIDISNVNNKLINNIDSDTLDDVTHNNLSSIQSILSNCKDNWFSDFSCIHPLFNESNSSTITVNKSISLLSSNEIKNKDILFNEVNIDTLLNQSTVGNKSQFKEDSILSLDESIPNRGSFISKDEIGSNKKDLELLLNDCRLNGLQIIKLSTIKSSSVQNKQIIQLAITVSTLIEKIGDIASICLDKAIYALFLLSIWKSSDELMLSITEYFLNKDEIRSDAIMCFIGGALLVKTRSLTSTATRTFLRVIEIAVKKRPDIVISGLLARIVQPCPSNSNINDLYYAYNSNVSTSPGVPQFELLQRSSRQLLSKSQIDVMLNLICFHRDGPTSFDIMNNDIRQFNSSKIIHSLDALLSPLALGKTIFNQSLSNVSKSSSDFVSILSQISSSWTTLLATPTWKNLEYTGANWDSDSLKILNSILSSDGLILSINTLSSIVIKLDEISTLSTIIRESSTFATVLHTIVTRFSTLLMDDLKREMKTILCKCSSILAKSALTTLEKN